jgi:hypothetical protein
MNEKSAAGAPAPEAVLDGVKRALSEFDAARVVFLDAGGCWRRGPRSVRQRASNELWFRLWKSAERGTLVPDVRSLFLPLVQGPVEWGSTTAVFSELVGGGLHGASPVTVLASVLGHFMEVEASRLNSEAYVPDWDRRAADQKRGFLALLEGFRSEFGRRLGARGADSVGSIMSALEADPDGMFMRLSRLLAREEWMNEVISGLLEAAGSGERAAYDLLREEVDAAMRSRHGLPEALIRPCIYLISDAKLDVSSGVQYQAVSFLGQAADTRAAEALAAALERFPPEYTALRANIVYALGRLRQPGALGHFRRILTGPRSVAIPGSGDSPGFTQSLDPEKREAVWALARLPETALAALPELVRCVRQRDKSTLAHLAYALGGIGLNQRAKGSDVSPGVVRTLERLVASEHLDVFEEAAVSLAGLGLRYGVERMDAAGFRASPILSLKPSSTGLYELSDTILHLISVKKPVVMAVTGDSGTGKTYFCRAIAGGFAGVEPGEILYLMRDQRENKTFDHMLGVDWLRKHVDPEFYTDHRLLREGDDPDEFFRRFIARHSDRKLIILDGWRDQAYFNQVIRIFYDKGYLDIMVRFRTTLSTRRINLEEREGSLDRVQAHLPLVEEPSIEETPFYTEGAVLVYNLDNSIPSRLDREETLEVFRRKKVVAWEEHIRVGGFAGSRPARPAGRGCMASKRTGLKIEQEEHTWGGEDALDVRETHFTREPNPDPGGSPYLLETVRAGGLTITGIDFYTHGQLAFHADGGRVGVLVGYDDRCFHAATHEDGIAGFAVAGRDLVSVGGNGAMAVTSLVGRTRRTLTPAVPPCSTARPSRGGGLITGHVDGTLRLWDMSAVSARVLGGEGAPVVIEGRDRLGRICSVGKDRLLRIYDLAQGTESVLERSGLDVLGLAFHPDGRLILALGPGVRGGGRPQALTLRLVDPETGDYEAFDLPLRGALKSLRAYFDGRILIGLGAADAAGEDTLFVFDPGADPPSYTSLGGHSLETGSVVTMGPRIISCGKDTGGESSIRLWGTSSYVRAELEKLSLLQGAETKPPYYRSLF